MASPILDDPGINIVRNPDPIFLINRGLAWAIILAFLLSVMFIFYGGLTFILSGGKEDKVKTAVRTIRYAIIGLVVTLLATTIISVLGRIFGYNFLGEIIDFNRIFSEIRTIIDAFTAGGGSAGRSL